MRQFDVVEAPGEDRGFVPYLVVLQSDLLIDLDTRLAAPLLAPDRFQPIRHLNPVFEIAGEPWMMATQMTAAVPRGELDGIVVINLAPERDAIIRAIDFVLAGV